MNKIVLEIILTFSNPIICCNNEESLEDDEPTDFDDYPDFFALIDSIFSRFRSGFQKPIFILLLLTLSDACLLPSPLKRLTESNKLSQSRFELGRPYIGQEQEIGK
ncbi:hypothetical protein ACTXT7_005073 [Hymenolepis weldensis]